MFNVQILNAETGKELIGKTPPLSPIDAQTYTNLGLPFFNIKEESSTVKGDFDKVQSVEHFYKSNTDTRSPHNTPESLNLNPNEPKNPFRILTDIYEKVKESNVASFEDEEGTRDIKRLRRF